MSDSERDELIDLLAECVCQGCQYRGPEGRESVSHGFLSAYEAAFKYFGLGDIYSVTPEQFWDAVTERKVK